MRLRRLVVVLAAGAATLSVAHLPADPALPPPAVEGAVAVVPLPSPFAGTPAETFPVGAAGIVPPEPDVVPDGYRVNHRGEMRDLTVGEVAEALAWVRAALIAARLEKPMLVHHFPEPFIATLAPTYATQWLYPLPGTREWYDSAELANYATMLASGTELATVPRVTGRIAFRSSTDDWGRPGRDDPISILEIVTRFVWVYRFDRPGGGIVVVRAEAVWVVPTDYRARFLWIDHDPNEGIHRRGARARAWGADCQLYAAEGHLRPGSPATIPDTVFDVDQPLEPVPGCQPGAE